MVTRVASASASGTSGTASVVNPAGIIPGDLIILAVAHQNSISSVPTGFSLISSTGQYTYATASVYAKMATAGEPSSYEVATSGSYISVVLAAYRNAKQEFAVSTVGITDVTTSIKLPLQGRVAQTASDMEFVFHAVGSSGSEQLPYLDTTGLTPPMFTTVVASSGGSGPAYALWDRQVQGIGTQDTVSVWAQISGSALSSVAVRVIISTQTNIAPDAPTLVAPGDGAALDRQQAQVFDWQFNDPNPGDSQSAYNLAYRLTGAPTWTETGWVTSTATQRSIAGGTFLVGDYEWRVATKDALGVESPWSSTGFFTATDAPPGPTITDPPNGGTISTSEYPVAWSTPDQDAYQLQVIDGETVLFDTGQVNQPTARSRPTQFPDNNTTRTIRLRILYGGLWSPWSTATVIVSYTPPPVPWLTATPVDVGAGVPSAIRVDMEDPRLRVDARNLATNPSVEVAQWPGSSPTTVERASEWAAAGDWSMRLTPNGTTFETFVSPIGDTGAIRAPLYAGGTFTIAATLHLTAPQVVGLGGRPRRVVLFYKNAAGSYIEVYGTQAPSEAGEFRSVVTATIPADATEAFIRLYNGSNAPTDIVWWDALTIVEGVTSGDYFDGDTPADDTYTYRWTGPEHASTSERLVYGTEGELAESTEPMVVAHDVWVRGGPEGEIRLVADLPASLPYLWHLPASGVEYEFRARAIGDNGTSSWSDWTP